MSVMSVEEQAANSLFVYNKHQKHRKVPFARTATGRID